MASISSKWFHRRPTCKPIQLHEAVVDDINSNQIKIKLEFSN